MNNRKKINLNSAILITLLLIGPHSFAQVKMDNVPIAEGVFQPDWKQVGDHYKTPSWFNEAKFGIWIHWGAQAMGRSGDWFAKFMYYPFGDWTNNGAYQNHLAKWGHPSVSGYTEVLKDWKAQRWDPQKIMRLYKESGAKYVMILGTHHDNFDNWDSKYQPWNAVNVGPKKDIVDGWVKAAKAEGMHYGISFHADYSWWWWQAAFASDTAGDKKGVPYDAAQRDTDAGTGYPLKDLYGLNLKSEIPAGKDPRDDFFSFVPEQITDTAYARWYCTKWCNRVKDLVDHYNPDILYFDGSTYPFSGFGTGRGFKSDATIRMAAHLYNQSMKKNGGKLEALLFTKGYDDARAISSTHESTVPDVITDKNGWMSENTIGEWFYKPGIYYSTGMVIHQMIEAFSRGGNYMINFPINDEGELDEGGIQTLKEIGRWMKTNGEAIYGSTAWKVTGEGKTKMPDGNLRKEQDVTFTAEDIRFTTHKGAVYAFVMSPPTDNKVLIRTLAMTGKFRIKNIRSVTMLGTTEKMRWNQTVNGLEIHYRKTVPNKNGFVLKILGD
ncbi:MAG: alpha-L-fucosidase [Agriterribacter sp.]